MSVSNESSRLRSWFQFSKSKTAEEEDNMAKESQEWQSNNSQTLLERVTSLRRSLSKGQQRKNKIRPTAASSKGLTSTAAVEQQNIAKSKNISPADRKSSPTATSGDRVNCDDEIYGFTSANLESSNSTRRALKSSLHASTVSTANASNISAYESECNKSGRVRNDDESHANASNNVNANVCKTVSQRSPEWLKADTEFSYYNQHQHQRGVYYAHQYYHDSDISHSASHSSMQWTSEPVNEPDDIDRIYENMRHISTSSAAQQRLHNSHRNSTSSCSTANNLSDTVSNNNNRKLTKDSGYESASTSISSTWGAMNALTNNSYFHSRSDSNASSVSTGGSLSPRTAGSSTKGYSYGYYEPQWSAAKSTSNLPLQVHSSSNNNNIRRSSLTGAANVFLENSTASNGKSVLPAKSVPGNLDRESDDTNVQNRSHNRNNPTPLSIYSLLTSKSGLDFTAFKSPRKTLNSNYISEDSFAAKYANERTFSKNSDSSGNSQLWKMRDRVNVQNASLEDSPPPTPPIRDSSLASNRKANTDLPQNDAQSKCVSESANVSDTATRDQNYPAMGVLSYKSKFYKNYSSLNDKRVNNSIGYSKSLVNLRPKYDDSDLKLSQTYPLLPETESDTQLSESWSCDQSVTSVGTGVASLVTSSDYFTASSSALTHSPSLSSLNTNMTSVTFNYNRNSVSSSTGSHSSTSQIARSAKVMQPLRQESKSVTYYEKPDTTSEPHSKNANSSDLPAKPNNNNSSELSTVNTTGSKMVFLDPSKTNKTSDTEIKAIQKRALYQYLKQKQQEMHTNCKSSTTATTTDNENTNTAEDNVQVPSRKVQLVVHENIYENSLPPSPPLPPPPVISEPELSTDLPLPPPPQSGPHQNTVSIVTHTMSQKISATEPSYSVSIQQTSSVPQIAVPLESSSLSKCAESVSSKSEMATQTTETLRRNSSVCSKSDKEMSQKSQMKDESTEAKEVIYQNEITNGNISQVSKESSHCPQWAYSKLWPNARKSSKFSYDGDNGYSSMSSVSPISEATIFINNTTGASLSSQSLTNEDLLANKSELITRLTRKLEGLRSEEQELNHDMEANELLGQQVKAKLRVLGMTNHEADKINVHCDETEKVTRLLLSISARLQQIERQLKEINNRKRINDDNNESDASNSKSESKQHHFNNGLHHLRDIVVSNSFDDTQPLIEKRNKLLTQLEEALQLRASIENRCATIEDRILKKYFKDNTEDVSDFVEFVKLKSKLIVDLREVKDKILLGEKQLQALNMY